MHDTLAVVLESYRAAVWSAVGTLWTGFARPEQMIAPAFPQAAPFIEDMHQQGSTAEAAAVEIVLQVVGAYVGMKMSADERRAALGEMQQILTMSFEEAASYTVSPIVAHTQQAWLVAKEWEAAGTVEPNTSKRILQHMISALAA